MPAAHQTLSEPTYQMAPPEIQPFLYSRGWSMGADNLWYKSDTSVGGQEFQWPEALSYEMFRTFFLMKDKDES